MRKLAIVLGFLGLLIASMSHAVSGPIYPHDPEASGEFKILYNEKADARTSPKISIGAGAPTFAPKKEGDIFVSTTTAKIYVSTGTESSASWVILN